MPEELENTQTEELLDGESENETPDEEEEQGSSFHIPIVPIIIVVVIAGLIGFFFGWPHYSSAKQKQAELSTKQEELQAKELQLEQLIAESDKPHELTPEEETALRLLPNEESIPNMIRLLDRISYLDDESDFDDTFLRSFSIAEGSGSGPYRTTAISGSFSSSRYSLVDLLRRFENNDERIFNISQISINLGGVIESEPVALFGNATLDVQYQILNAKRASFLLTDEEADELADLQSIIETEYLDLLRQRTRSELEDERLQNLKSELDLIQAETQYSLSLETYVDNIAASNEQDQ